MRENLKLFKSFKNGEIPPKKSKVLAFSPTIGLYLANYWGYNEKETSHPLTNGWDTANIDFWTEIPKEILEELEIIKNL